MHSTHAHAQQPAMGVKNIPIAAPPDEHEPDDLQAALRAHAVAPRASSAGAWGGYDHQIHRVGTGVLSGYGGVQDAGGFGGAGGGVGGGGGLLSPTVGVNRVGSFGGLGGNLGGNQQQQVPRGGSRLGLTAGGVRAEESVTITALPEKEGMFLFQHRNYQISSGRRASRVVRRYSDFVW